MNNPHIPGYLEGIQADLKTVIHAAENAATYIETGPTYQNPLHPYHAAAVNTYNKMVSLILEIEKLVVEE